MNAGAHIVRPPGLHISFNGRTMCAPTEIAENEDKICI